MNNFNGWMETTQNTGTSIRLHGHEVENIKSIKLSYSIYICGMKML